MKLLSATVKFMQGQSLLLILVEVKCICKNSLNDKETECCFALGDVDPFHVPCSHCDIKLMSLAVSYIWIRNKDITCLNAE